MTIAVVMLSSNAALVKGDGVEDPEQRNFIGPGDAVGDHTESFVGIHQFH